MKTTVLAGAALGVLLALGQPTRAQDLVIGTKLEVNTLDPHFFSAFPTRSSHESIFGLLVGLDTNLNPRPDLAESWKTIDPLTWEFKLRRGVKFHDGGDFTAEDVLFTFARVPNVPNTPNGFGQYVSSITKAEKLDDHTLRFTTSAPNPTLLQDLSRVFILSARAAKGMTTADFNAGRGVVGTGPYKLIEWVNGDRLVLERFDGYWGKPYPWKKVTERVMARDSARVAALLSGEVDVIDVPPVADLPRLKADPKLSTFSGPAAIIQYIAFDIAREPSPFVTAKDGKPLDRNPLKDARVRKALSLALNRDAIAERLMEGTAIPAAQLLPSNFEGTSQALKPDPFDLDKARGLLREAGWADGFRLVLHATNDRYPNDTKVAQGIGQMWTRLGLTVEIDTMPGAIFFTRASKQDFSLFMGQYGTTEASQPLRALVATWDKDRGLGSANRTRFSDPEFDKLLQQAMETFDPAERARLLAQSSEMAMARQAVIPIFFPTFEFAARKGLVVDVKPERAANGTMVRPAS